MHYLLFYEVSDDYLSRRAEFRQAHLEKVWAASERGELVLAGALANPVDGAVLLFNGNSPEVAEKFANADPYVTSGAVRRWYVREWTTVAGENAATPVRPNVIAADKTGLIRSSTPSRKDLVSPEKGAILRMWRARSTADKAGEYVQHAKNKILPMLGSIEGHCGAYLLRRKAHGEIEFVVLTLWESMDAVGKFAGAEPDKAVVEPEARAILTSFDNWVTHFEVVHQTQVTPRTTKMNHRP